MRVLPSLLAVALALPLGGCSLRAIALNAVADELSGGTGGTFTQDEDLLFVGEALPFALKLMEGIGEGVPEHTGMDLTLASGFVQYGAVFVEWPAEQLRFDDYQGYQEGKKRAKGFYLRGNNYALDALDLLHPGFRSNIFADTKATLEAMEVDDVPFLFWAAAGWLLAASTDLEDPEMFGVLFVASDVMLKAYELDPTWNGGMIPSTLISLEPNIPGPDPRGRSRARYEEALGYVGESSAGVHVSLATAVALKEQDKAQFVELLNKALDVDLNAFPDNRLANDYAQQRAQFLLDHLDDLFLE